MTRFFLAPLPAEVGFLPRGGFLSCVSRDRLPVRQASHSTIGNDQLAEIKPRRMKIQAAKSR